MISLAIALTLVITLTPAFFIFFGLIISGDSYPVSKTFRTVSKILFSDTGIPTKELMERGCLRADSLELKLDRFLLDPRLNEEQRIEMIKDVYSSDDTFCPFTSDGVHIKEIEGYAKEFLTSYMLKGKTLRKLTPETFGLIVNGTPVDGSGMRLVWTVLRGLDSDSRAFNTLDLFLNNTLLLPSDFKQTFNRVVLAVDKVFKESRVVFEPKQAFTELMLKTLNNPSFSDADILSICYDTRGWLRDIAIQSPRPTKEGKIAAGLMGGSLGTIELSPNLKVV